MNESGSRFHGAPKSLAIALGALALVELLKHAALLSLGQMQPWGDSSGYWSLAGDAAAGDWWLVGSGLAYRTPGYPWFLAVCRCVFDECGLLAAVSLQHASVLVTSAATTWLTWHITRRSAATIAASLWCLGCTARPLYANWLLTESLATCVLTLVVVVLVLVGERRSWRWLAVAGGVLGVGVLLRPSLLAATPVLLIAGWWVAKDRGQRGIRRVVTMLMGVIVLGLMVTPWCVRNHILFDRFAVTIFTGRELWKTAFDPWPGGELPIPTDGAGAQIRERIVDDSIDLRHNWTVSGALSQSGLKDHEVDRLMEQAAWQAIGRDPARTSFRTLARCATFWYVWEWETNLDEDAEPATFVSQHRIGITPWRATLLQFLKRTPERWPPAMWLWSVATWLGVAALLIRPESRQMGVLLAMILGGATVLTAALEVPLYRYRLVLEPLMIVAAVAGLSGLIGYLGARRQRDDSSSDQG